MDEELQSHLNHELGQILDWEELCPGVYYIGIRPDPDSEYPWSEYYMVLDGAPITQTARALGKSLAKTSVLLYPIDPPKEGTWTAVLYEVCKYRHSHDISIPSAQRDPHGWSLTDAAIEGMELCPDYFGTFPVPPLTPWGWTLWHRALDNGIYWVETSQGQTVLAVCQPIWSTEFSDAVRQAGKKQPHDVSAGSEDLGYLFFNEETSCTAVFELLKVRPEWMDMGLIHKQELMNAIWERAPMYAATYNAEEQAGLHDGLGILLQMLGEDSEPQGSDEHMISLRADVGTDFIGFWK